MNYISFSDILDNKLSVGTVNLKLNYNLFVGSLNIISGLPDPLFRIRPEPDPDFFLKLISGRNRIRIFFSN